MRALAVLAALAVTSPVYGQGLTLHREFGDGWSVYAGSEGCLVQRSYDDGNGLTVTYFPKNNDAFLHIENSQATSIADGAEVQLFIWLTNGRDLDDGWGSKKFETSVNEDGQRSFMTHLDGRVLLEDLARNTIIAFSTDADLDRMLGSYGLDGSARAIAALRTCAFDQAGLNPNDPFLR